MVTLNKIQEAAKWKYFQNVYVTAVEEAMHALGHPFVSQTTLENCVKYATEATEFYEIKLATNQVEDYKCFWHNVSRHVLETELIGNKDFKGTKNYTDMGCYDCPGTKSGCLDEVINKEYKQNESNKL